MSASNISTIAQSLSIALPVNKKGEVSKATHKAGRLLSENRGAIVGAALYGSGAVASVARATLRAVVPTLEGMLSRDSIDGSEWGTLLALLVADGGMADYAENGHKGKQGCIAYATTAYKAAELAYMRADTVKAQDRAINRIERAGNILAQVNALVASAEHARMLADQATADQATADQATADQATADTAENAANECAAIAWGDTAE